MQLARRERERTMRRDLDLITYTNGRLGTPVGVSCSAVRAAFGEHVRWEADNSGWAQYDGGGACRVWIVPFKDKPDFTSFVSLKDPVSDERLWESLYQVMRLGNFVAHCFTRREWGLGQRLLIADPQVAAHLNPKDVGEEHFIAVNNAAEMRTQALS